MRLSASQTLSVFFLNLEGRPVAGALGERLMTQFLVPEMGCVGKGARHVALGSVAFGKRQQNNFLKAVPSQVSGRVNGLAIVIKLRKRVAAVIVLRGH